MSKDRFIRATFSPESARVPQRIRDFYEGDNAPTHYSTRLSSRVSVARAPTSRRTSPTWKYKFQCDFFYGVNLIAIHRMVMQEIGMQLEELRRVDERDGTPFADAFATGYLEQLSRELWASGFLVPQDVELLREVEEEVEIE